MPRPTSRVLALLEILQAGGIRTVADLADRLGVDPRTIRRYAEHLRELEIPVEAVRGRYGGYQLAAHAQMPPLMLTDEEAVATVWALLEAAEVGPGPAGPLAATTALAKIRRVLPQTLASSVDAVVDAVAFAPTAAAQESRGHDAVRPASDVDAVRTLLQLAGAARDLHPVRFDHLSRHGRATQREVRPHGVVAHRGRLYLAGFDVDKAAPRSFRLDRISRVQVSDVHFPASDDVDPVRQVLGPLSESPSRQDVTVRIRTDVAHLRSRVPEMLASVTVLPAQPPEEPGWLRVFLRAERLHWVLGNLVILDRPFIIEEPVELRQLAADVAGGLARTADAFSENTAVEAWQRPD